MSDYTVKKEEHRVYFDFGQYKDVTAYYVINAVGSVCATTSDPEEAEAIRADFERDESDYRKMLAGVKAKEGIPKWQFVDENSEG